MRPLAIPLADGYTSHEQIVYHTNSIAEAFRLQGEGFRPGVWKNKRDDLSKLMAQALMTTHKDMVKIEPVWRELAATGEEPIPVLVLEIEARPEEGFWNMLEASLNIDKKELDLN